MFFGNLAKSCKKIGLESANNSGVDCVRVCVSGGGCARGHVVDRAGSSALVADRSAVGADGVWSGGDQRGGAEEGGALPGGG